jgi:hypothetical protein
MCKFPSCWRLLPCHGAKRICVVCNPYIPLRSLLVRVGARTTRSLYESWHGPEAAVLAALFNNEFLNRHSHNELRGHAHKTCHEDPIGAGRDHHTMPELQHPGSPRIHGVAAGFKSWHARRTQRLFSSWTRTIAAWRIFCWPMDWEGGLLYQFDMEGRERGERCP